MSPLRVSRVSILAPLDLISNSNPTITQPHPSQKLPGIIPLLDAQLGRRTPAHLPLVRPQQGILLLPRRPVKHHVLRRARAEQAAAHDRRDLDTQHPILRPGGRHDGESRGRKRCGFTKRPGNALLFRVGLPAE